MTETTQTLRDDIAFMRALADEGVRPPLTAGPFLMTAGLNWGAASFLIDVLFRFHKDWIWLEIVYGASAVIFFVSLPFLIRDARRKPGARSPANRAVGTAFSGAGWGIFALAACVLIMGFEFHSSLPGALMPSGILILYGVAWSVAASMTRDRLLWAIAFGSFIGALAMAAFVKSQGGFAVFGVILIAVAFIPGCILWRREPKTVV